MLKEEIFKSPPCITYKGNGIGVFSCLNQKKIYVKSLQTFHNEHFKMALLLT